MCCSFFAFPIMQTYFVQYILMVACDIQANIFSISFYKNHIYKCCIQNSFIDRISMINKNIKIIKNFFALLSFFYLETEIQVIDTDKSYYVIPVCARFFFNCHLSWLSSSNYLFFVEYSTSFSYEITSYHIQSVTSRILVVTKFILQKHIQRKKLKLAEIEVL